LLWHCAMVRASLLDLYKAGSGADRPSQCCSSRSSLAKKIIHTEWVKELVEERHKHGCFPGLPSHSVTKVLEGAVTPYVSISIDSATDSIRTWDIHMLVSYSAYYYTCVAKSTLILGR
jgi:hypothetical protein